MNKAEDYASDSDQSDEDFCPEKEIAAGNSASEEDSESENEIEEENTEVQQTKAATKKSSKKTKKCKKQSNKADGEKEAAECEDQLEEHKKVTRQSENNGRESKSVHDKDELESDEDEKTRSDSLWADFLSDVKPVAKKSTETNAEAKTSKTKDKLENGHKNEKSQTSVETAEAAKKVTVTDIFDFAGEEVRVEKTVSIDSIKENKVTSTATGSPFARKSSAAAALKRPSIGGGGGGLGSVLNQIGKKKKISVLDKTKLDWSSFKQNEGIDEDLQTYNKGKDGYLERQDFLQRTDLRQFEIEKNLRQTRRH